MSFSYGRIVVPGSRDPVLREYRPTRVSVGWLVMVVLAAVVGGHVLWFVARIGGIGLPYGLTDGLILAGFLAWRVTQAVHGPPVPLPANLLPPTSELADRPFAGARRWEDRLGWTHDDPIAFNRTVRVQLASIVDERLHGEYSIALDGSGPGGVERVRAVLGVQLWTLLTEPADRVPRSTELAAAVAEMERVFKGGMGD